MTWDPVSIAAVAGAVAYGAASGVFRAVAEHRRSIAGNLGPRVEDVQRRLSYVEGLLGIKLPSSSGGAAEDITPVLRPPPPR